MILYLQEYFGVRFMIPGCILPKPYNYFVNIPTQIDLENEELVEFAVNFLFMYRMIVSFACIHFTMLKIQTQKKKPKAQLHLTSKE